jgi:hypothetical protein
MLLIANARRNCVAGVVLSTTRKSICASLNFQYFGNRRPWVVNLIDDVGYALELVMLLS